MDCIKIMAENAEDQTNQRKEVRRGRGALAFSYRRGYRKYKPHVERSKRGIHPNNPDSVNVAESTVEQPISRTESLHTTRVVTVDAACGNDLGFFSLIFYFCEELHFHDIVKTQLNCDKVFIPFSQLS